MKKQRKFLMVLPLLIIPFLTMAFWALGGGRVKKQAISQRGLDTNLPQAQFNDKGQRTDKLAIYQITQKDSSQAGVSSSFLKAVGFDNKSSAQPAPVVSADDESRKIQIKLERLNKQLNNSTTAEPAAMSDPEPANIAQLRKMMRSRTNSEQPDPEMQQLNQMLDKIQSIQNPGSVTPKPIKTEPAKPFKAIPAVVDGKQKVADGAAVKLKLTDTATIKGQLLPIGQEVFGSCQVINQRLLLTIQNIRIDKQIIPVNITVFSLDGMAGIPAPEAELAGSASTGADNTLQGLQLMSMDQSIGTQAAVGGISAAKDLFSKKIKKIKVKLQNQYPVLLKINQ